MLKPLLACLPVLLLSTTLLPPIAIAEQPSGPTLTNAKVTQDLEVFTVKIGSGQTIGSGTLLGKKGNTYLVLTNRHVIAENTSFTVSTYDDQAHRAIVVENAFPPAYDLALLTFSSSVDYRLPTIAGFTPQTDQHIFTGSYHAETGEFQGYQTVLKRFLSHKQTLRQGYRLGYGGKPQTNMGGGPIIERDSQSLIGINGHSAHPVLNDYNHLDGSTPTAAELEQLRQLNWGIPIDTVLAQLKPELLLAYQLPAPNTPLKLAKPNWTGWLKDLENRAKHFTVRVDNQTTGGNGSGVIVAREGNTYTVLTAEHVLDQKGENHQFSVLTHDGENHVIKAKNIRRQPGVDLASFQFESEVNYPVATLANYPRNESDVVFVAGFPKVGKEGPQWLMSGGTIYEEEQGRFQISNTRIASQQQGIEQSPLTSLQVSFAQGYDMVYTSITYRGMSGGPVLDSEGRVVGIHGQAEGEPEEDSSQGVIQLGNSLGIPISTLLPQADKLKINPNIIDKSSANEQLSPLELSKLQDSLLTISVPSSNASAAIWIQRGNQLHRLQRYQQAIDAFEQAIQLSDVNPEYQHLAYFGKALILREQSNFQQAVDTLKIALRKEPNYTPAWYYLAINYRILNNYKEALLSINRAIRQQPGNANFLNEKYTNLSRLGWHQEALNIINKALEVSRRAAFYGNRGNTYTYLNEYSKANADFNKAIQLNPEDAKIYNNRGIIHHTLKKYPQAIFDYNKAVNLDPKYSDAYINRGSIYSDLREYSKAIADYSQAIFLNPDNAVAYYNRGNTYSDLKEYSKAISDYSQAIIIKPKYFDAYLNRGNAFYDLNEYPQAISDYSQAVTLKPDNAMAYFNRGNAFKSFNQFSEAIADYSKVLTLNPHNVRAYNNRGNTFRVLRKYHEAIADHDKAIALEPSIADLYNDRGLVYAELKEYPQAIADFGKAIKLDSDHSVAYYNRGNNFSEMKDYSKAIEDYSKAIEITPGFAEAFNNRGNVYVELGEYHQAIDNYTQALEINPNDETVYNSRANIFLVIEQYPQAITDYSKVIKLNPNFAEAYSRRGLSYLQTGKLMEGKRDLKVALTLFRQQGNMVAIKPIVKLLERLEAQ